TITPEFSDKVTIGNVIRQTVSYKKRVLHDTPVDLVISDGPKQDFAADTSGTTDGANPSIDSNTPGNETMPTAPDGTGTSANQTPDEPPRLFDRTIRIPEDGQGIRQVRIEFRDSRGWQPPVIADELHTEGDRIPVTFDYYGKNITLRIYYDDKLKKEFTFGPQ